jgi:Ca2+-binding EF-hand superfamily protein
MISRIFQFQKVNVPMSPKALDRLINKLDEDGDGEVDFK